eukprot:TRINITY_DN8106_c0_g1_i1.p1 TRINITY_DN8106_c0_g1~~TRINITY_DN8106_c0_g1_i1.p1  ORF type:complete len:223 (-),score=34.57 TRINITY_DN8106_c0_g1_i1:18-686(-)
MCIRDRSTWGNPFFREFANYRKTMIANIKNLTFLEDRPVTDNERRTVEAWWQNGKEGELQERQKIFEEVKQKDQEYIKWIKSLEQLAENKDEANIRNRPYYYQIVHDKDGQITVYGDISVERKLQIKKKYLIGQCLNNRKSKQHTFELNDPKSGVDFKEWNENLDKLLKQLQDLSDSEIVKLCQEYNQMLKEANKASSSEPTSFDQIQEQFASTKEQIKKKP